jgi:hypothetical protein
MGYMTAWVGNAILDKYVNNRNETQQAAPTEVKKK